MARIYKRTRRKTGPHSWQTITHRNDGTTFTSSSTKVGGNTTNISSRGVRKTTNNKGWIQTSFAPAFPKPKKSGTKSRSKKSNSAGFLGTLLFGALAKSKKKPAAKKTTAPKTTAPKVTSAPKSYSSPKVTKKVKEPEVEVEESVFKRIEDITDPVILEKQIIKPELIGPPKPPSKLWKVVKWLIFFYVMFTIVGMFMK